MQGLWGLQGRQKGSQLDGQKQGGGDTLPPTASSCPPLGAGPLTHTAHERLTSGQEGAGCHPEYCSCPLHTQVSRRPECLEARPTDILIFPFMPHALCQPRNGWKPLGDWPGGTWGLSLLPPT